MSLSFYAEKVEDHSVAKFVGQEKEEEIFFLVLVSDYTKGRPSSVLCSQNADP